MLRPQRRDGEENGGTARPFSVKCGKFCLRAGETNHMKVALVAQIVHRNAHVQHDKLKLSGTHTPTHQHTNTHTRAHRERYFGAMPAPHTQSAGRTLTELGEGRTRTNQKSMTSARDGVGRGEGSGRGKKCKECH